jgi:hypothetical protein
MLVTEVHEAVVCRRDMQYDYPDGALALFKFLQTPKGLEVLDPFTPEREHTFAQKSPVERFASRARATLLAAAVRVTNGCLSHHSIDAVARLVLPSRGSHVFLAC